jgi:hypothetical protein
MRRNYVCSELLISLGAIGAVDCMRTVVPRAVWPSNPINRLEKLAAPRYVFYTVLSVSKLGRGEKAEPRPVVGVFWPLGLAVSRGGKKEDLVYDCN